MIIKDLGPAPETVEVDVDPNEREFEALRKIEAALLPLSKDEQTRVIACAAILFGLELPPPIAAAPPPTSFAARVAAPTWKWRPKARSRPRHCRGCGSIEHDKRKCPLNFEIVVDTGDKK